jgi:hypothetical protein
VSIEIWKALVVDRVHLTIPVGQYVHSVLMSILTGLPDMQSDHVPKGKITITKKYAHTRVDWYPAKKRKIAEMEVGASKSGHRYFRLTLYRSKFGPEEFEYFKFIFTLLMPWTYKQLFDGARVSYIELAADSLSHVAHTFVPFRPKCSYSKIYVDKKGELGTTYLGSPLSALMFRIYDKHRQQLQTGFTPAYKTHTRIEAASRHTGLTVSELTSKMANPFLRLEIADLLTARQLTNDETWQAFLDRALAVGSAQALSEHPKQRRQYVKLLRMAAASWWKSEDPWNGLPKALEAIAP